MQGLLCECRHLYVEMLVHSYEFILVCRAQEPCTELGVTQPLVSLYLSDLGMVCTWLSASYLWALSCSGLSTSPKAT